MTFKIRSNKPERIDTGDYTREEYEQFLIDIRFINRYFGDKRALRKYQIPRIKEYASPVKVLDVGAGSGELLRVIADSTNQEMHLVGLDYNSISADSINTNSAKYKNLNSVRGDAFSLPFADDTFDITITSLFLHHLTDSQIVSVLNEMSRVSKDRVVAIDLHRHRVAHVLYRIMCRTFGISRLVLEDGSLSILRSFVPKEFEELGKQADFDSVRIKRSAPFRLVLEGRVS